MTDYPPCKDDLRKRYLQIRASLSADERRASDAIILEKLLSQREFRDAELVFTYLSVAAEVDTREIVQLSWKAGKTVAVPRCVPKTREMTWHALANFDCLERSGFGIDEPIDDPATLMKLPDPTTAAVALVPGLAFDSCGYRLGYGGGYYDTFLPRFTGTSIGLCRMSQLSAKPLPRAPHDTPVDLVLTDSSGSASPAHQRIS